MTRFKLNPDSNAASRVVEQAEWPVELWQRIRTLWVRKMLATTFGCSAFMVVYFWILHHPLYPVTMMPVTTIDRAIGVEPLMLPLYLSLWLYVSLVPALLKTGREFNLYAFSTFVLSVIGLGIFMLWPTAVPRFDIDWAQFPSMAFMRDMDMAGNAFPSMHVAFSVFTAILLGDVLRQMRTTSTLRKLNWLWCAGILYSTLATAQHVVLDVVGGVVLGSIAAWFHFALVRFGQGDMAERNKT